jgi:zeta-carotene desaturase
MQWAFDRGALTGGAAPHLSLVSSGAAAVVGLSNDAIASIALRELRDALPQARSAAVRRASVVRERRATFSLAPGQPARPAAETALGGFHLAGDWTDTGLPGTIESAAASGHRAADAVSGGGRRQLPAC